MENLRSKIYSGSRITPEEALELFSWDLLDLGRAAAECLTARYGDKRVGFIVDRIVNFTNLCEARCRFCAYHARAGKIDAFELSHDQIIEKVRELVNAGGTQVMLQGGIHPHYSLEDYIAMVSAVRAAFPDIYLHSFSPAEIVHMSEKSGLSETEVVQRLKSAGLNSVPGASDLLVDRIRRSVSPRKIGVDQWRRVMRALAENGMKSSATMTYGMGETIEERVEHLRVVRDIQDETGILRAFIPWSFSPANTDMEDVIPATGLDYLRIVAVARIFLDNIRYMQAGWLTEGLKLAQAALAMGANDMGGVLTEEIVVKATGVTTSTTMEEMIDIIRNAGFVPVQRDSEYTVIKEF